LQHPSIQRLQQQPSVKQAVDRVNSDPKIREILDSNQPISRSAAMTLLSHPAVMNLVDQPGFLEEATQAIQESEQSAVMTN
jgi:hypothetical protein